jgi:hypothetical protein
MTGSTVLRDDYTETRIRIAFRPTDGTFAVTDAAIERDPEYLPDVTVVWQRGTWAITKSYLETISARREVSDTEQERVSQAIGRLHDLQNCPFQVVELSDAATEEQVADIFVRINSEGVTLIQADFILTLMSVFWEKGRRDLEEFCRGSRLPSLSGASPFNWYLHPQPHQLLRATVAMAFRRAVLKHIYTLLRGREVETGKQSSERRDAQFDRLAEAQEHVLNLTHWHEFLLCLERAGFRGKRMISSDNAIIFSYAMWLIGRIDYGVPIDRLREVIARWFFMAHTTGRYSGTFETQVERDLGRLADVPAKDADGFVSVLSKVVNDTLTTDYWEITLPNELSSSASKSPALLAYIAALNIVDADALLSTGKVRARLDPAITTRKGIERHHLFPRAYLKKLGIAGTRQINQIANMALLDWNDNITVSDQAPSVYWPEQLASKDLHERTVSEQVRWHALPDGWTDLPYDEFLTRRRKLMAEVVRAAFGRLADQAYKPVYPAPSQPAAQAKPTKRAQHGVRVVDLIEGGLLPVGAVLVNVTDDVEATVLSDGRIEFDGTPYDSPSAAGDAAHGSTTNGWVYWLADSRQGLVALASLREELIGDSE